MSRLVLCVEGHTEKGIKELLSRWLAGRLEKRVGIDVKTFNGFGHLERSVETIAELELARKSVIAVVALADLHGPADPADRRSTEALVKERKRQIESQVGHPRFRYYSAVHDVEAWILADPDVLPRKVRDALPRKVLERPEAVNTSRPPAQVLGEAFKKAKAGKYRKRAMGSELLRRLDPAKVRRRCPHAKAMLDDLFTLLAEAQR